jgi:hypothetical protein
MKKKLTLVMNCKYFYFHPFLEYLGYKYDEKRCRLAFLKINEAIYVRFFVKIYLFLIFLLSSIPNFINLNKNFILFKFITGILMLIFESNVEFTSKPNESVRDGVDQNYDTVIVGSGPGGSIAALRCLERGEKVAIIESGNSFNPEEIEHHSLEQTTRQFNQQGMSFCFGNMPVLYAEGSTYGGGSEVNSGLYFKLSGPYKKEFLNKTGISEGEWEETEKLIEEKISVQKAPANSFDNLNSALLRGSIKEGLIVEEIPRWRSYEPILQHKSMQVTYLKQAEELGLKIYTNIEVSKILELGNEIHVKGVDRKNEVEKDIVIKSKKVVLAAGTVNTPKILKNSNLLNDTVSFNFHPMTRCVVDYGETVNDGDLFPPYQSWTKDYKFKFGYSVSSFPFVKATLASLGKYKNIPELSNLVCYFSSTVLDKSKGRILFFRKKAIPVIYITKKDRKKIKEGFKLLKKIMISSNVKNIWPKKNNPSLTSVHIFGSLPLNKNKDIGKYGELKINPNIKICDSSLLPIAPWGNPQAVMMVLNEILMTKWLKSFE